MKRKISNIRNTRLALALSICLLLSGIGVGIATGEVHHNQPTSTNTKAGGSVNVLWAGDVDFIDPGKTYYTAGFMVTYAIHRTLYGYKAPDYINPVPDLAAAPPLISKDEKKITIRIKHGIRFSPPVNREVTAADVKYAFDRAFTANVANGYAYTHFADLKGIPKKPGGYKSIPGVKVKDRYTLELQLTKPTADRTSAALVMPITAPVPKEYASKFDQQKISTYDSNVVFTGPYMVKNDRSGRLIGRQPGRSIELVRNPNWKKSTDFRPAYLDAITIKEGFTNLSVAGEQTLRGKSMVCCDGQPPARLLRLALTGHKQQVVRVSSGGTRWVALNTQLAPFNNLNVRKAIFAVFDRRALRLTRGGCCTGEIAKGFIPPGIPGYKESHGAAGFKDLDFTQHPKGNLELAKKYMLAARAQGVPNINRDGIYTGKELLAVGSVSTPDSSTALVAQFQFQKLGFHMKLVSVDQTTLYVRYCGIPRLMKEQHIAACLNVGWFRDYNDPQSLLEPTFSGSAIQELGNVNWSLLNNKRIDQAMLDAATVSGPARGQVWAKINHDITAQAPAIPYLWDRSFQLASKNVNLKATVNGHKVDVINGYTSKLDLSYLSLK